MGAAKRSSRPTDSTTSEGKSDAQPPHGKAPTTTSPPGTIKCRACKADVDDDHTSRKRHLIQMAHILPGEINTSQAIERCFKKKGSFMSTTNLHCQICGKSLMRTGQLYISIFLYANNQINSKCSFQKEYASLKYLYGYLRYPINC